MKMKVDKKEEKKEKKEKLPSPLFAMIAWQEKENAGRKKLDSLFTSGIICRECLEGIAFCLFSSLFCAELLTS